MSRTSEYTTEQKAAIISKIDGALKAGSTFADALGGVIAKTTYYKWGAQLAGTNGNGKGKQRKTTRHNYSTEEQREHLQKIGEWISGGGEMKDYLARNGLHSSYLPRWRQSALARGEVALFTASMGVRERQATNGRKTRAIVHVPQVVAQPDPEPRRATHGAIAQIIQDERLNTLEHILAIEESILALRKSLMLRRR